MSTHARCNFVVTVAITLMIALGASATYCAAVFLGGWAAVALITLIGVSCSPDLEIGIFSMVVAVLALIFTTFQSPLVLLLPGGAAGLLIFFRATPLLNWLCPRLGRSPKGS